MKYKIFLFIFLSCRIVTAQVSYKGIVKDAVNDEPISTVNVIFLKNYRKINKTLLYEKETDNDSLIVIRSFPKKSAKTGHLITRFYIDKKDTVFYKRVTENNAPFKNEKIYYKGKIF